MMIQDCQTSLVMYPESASQTIQQTTPSISQSAGRLYTPVPSTPPSVWVSDFFWVTLAISILIGAILEKGHKK